MWLRVNKNILYCKATTILVTPTGKSVVKISFKWPTAEKQFWLEGSQWSRPVSSIEYICQSFIWLGRESLELQWDLYSKLWLTVDKWGASVLFLLITYRNSVSVHALMVLAPWIIYLNYFKLVLDLYKQWFVNKQFLFASGKFK